MKLILRLVQFSVVVYLILSGLIVFGQAASKMIAYVWLNPTEGFERNWPSILLLPVLSPALLFFGYWLSRRWQFNVLIAGSIRSFMLATSIAVILTTVTQTHTLRFVDLSDEPMPRILLFRDYTFLGISIQNTTFNDIRSTQSEKTRQYLLRSYWEGDDNTAYIIGTLTVSFLTTWVLANYFQQRPEVTTSSAQ